MRLWQSVRGLPREVWLLCAAILINRAGQMALPFLSLYTTRHLGVAGDAAGMILGLYGAGVLLGAPIAGRLCDRIGAGRVMVGSLSIAGALLLSFPLLRGVPALAMGTLALATAAEAFRPASLLVLTELVPSDQRKPAYALSRAAGNVGFGIGPAIGGVLAGLWFPAIFIADGATSLLAALLLASSPLYHRRPSEVPQAADGAGRSALHDLSFVALLAGTTVAGMAYFQIQSTMPIHLVRHLGLRESTYGILIMLNSLLVVLVEVPLNGALARWPHARSLALGAALIGAGFGALAFVREAGSVAVTVVVWTFGEMILTPAATAAVTDCAPEGRTGEYLGWQGTMFGLSMGLGPWLGMAVLERFGPTVLWTSVLVSCAAAAALLGAITDRRTARATSEQVG
ncbi:major facilitator superfamily MFS_1 transporter [Minicystis rosea]|nr:major facilitator superfamily MFS_1 transporter [Minicystis rosea]